MQPVYSCPVPSDKIGERVWALWRPGADPLTQFFLGGGGGRLILCIRREVYLSIIFSVWSTFPAKMDAVLRMRVHLWYEM